MKTIRYLLLFILASCIALVGCKKYEDELTFNAGTDQEKVLKSDVAVSPPIKPWYEDFATSQSLSNWTLYGEPQPKWLFFAYEKYGLFDNNGPSPTKNFAVSHYAIGAGAGYSIEAEILIHIINPEGTCVCPGIAVSKDLNPIMKNGEIECGISSRLIYVGAEAKWFPEGMRGHTWLIMSYLTQDEIDLVSMIKIENSELAQWHSLKLQVLPSKRVKFFLDNEEVWAPNDQINTMMLRNKNIVLGYTSAGDPATRAGVAYHNWVKASYLIASPNR